MGPWLYVLLFAIVFCETGLVVTPFLPGDSLLFAAGALCSVPDSGLSVWAMVVLLITAAVLGDAVNYAVGAYMGPKVFSREDSRWLNKKHLQRTHEFYEKYGGKTIILARFVPIVRTFAPFVAGVGSMTYAKFFSFNVVGAVAWVAGDAAGGLLLRPAPDDPAQLPLRDRRDHRASRCCRSSSSGCARCGRERLERRPPAAAHARSRRNDRTWNAGGDR